MFKNPIAPKYKKVNSEFLAPSKEDATTGQFMDAGSDYGSGFKTPVGSKRASSIKDGPIPFGCKAMDPNKVRMP